MATRFKMKLYYLTVQSELSNARRDAEQAKLAQVELKSLTDQLEEQRQLNSQAEQALASAKVDSFSTACAHCSTYSCRHLRNGCPHKFTVESTSTGVPSVQHASTTRNMYAFCCLYTSCCV